MFCNIHTDDAIAAGPVIHDDLLAPCLGQLLPDCARCDVSPAAGYDKNNDAYRPRRINIGGE